jgi:lipopolysaccharide/colanic/teichoic acid biosynthesis glycosyltransferase
MRAIVMATGENDSFRLFSDRWPTGLMPLCGQPILQHLVEFLVPAGINDFDFVLRHLPEKVEAYLGDGSRWGSQFRYHLAPNGRPPHQRLNVIIGPEEGDIVLAREDTIPSLQPEWIRQTPAPVVFVDKKGAWTGWAVIPAGLATKISGAGDAAEFEACLLDIARSSGTVSVVECPISFATPGNFLESQGALLSGQGPQGSLLRWREAAPGVRIGRNVSLHPAVQIDAPVFIGDNCRIGPGTRLGPNAVIGDNCILESRSLVSHSVVLPGSYIGELLELTHAVVDHNRLANVRLNTEILVTDAFLLARLTETGLKRWLARTASRVLAVGLLLLLSPVLLLVAVWLKLFRTGPVLHYREAVRLPAEGVPAQWRTFRLPAFRPRAAGGSSLLLDVLPGLVSVASGDLALVGVEPRNSKEVSALPADWGNLYLQSKAGLITEAAVTGIAAGESDALYSAEAYYTAVAGFSHDLRLLCNYIGQLVTRPPKTGPTGGRESMSTSRR